MNQYEFQRVFSELGQVSQELAILSQKLDFLSNKLDQLIPHDLRNKIDYIHTKLLNWR